MEKLAGDQILRDCQEFDADDAFNFKEFLLVFYGAQWSQKSNEVADLITQALVELNPENEDAQQNLEVFYISNDRTKEEYSEFMKSCNEEVSWCALPWNDERIYEIKKAYNFDSLPQVLVLDKNLQVITTEAVDDLSFLAP